MCILFFYVQNLDSRFLLLVVLGQSEKPVAFLPPDFNLMRTV